MRVESRTDAQDEPNVCYISRTSARGVSPDPGRPDGDSRPLAMESDGVGISIRPYADRIEVMIIRG
jgi:hypothetical protein